MLSEILKIKPQLDASDLNKMVRSLNSRFAEVSKKFAAGLYNASKKFGGGMKSALTGGGVVGALGAILDRFLNPLQETTETLRRVLSEGDDLSTFASQFETTAAKLLRLQAVVGTAGIDPDTLRTMLTKFQVALAEQRKLEADPTKTALEKRGALSEFTGAKDTAEAFFQFIQALRKADKDTQVIVQTEVFGEKLIGKQAELLQTDFGQRLQQLNLPAAEATQLSIDNIARIEEIDAINRERRRVEDLTNKGQIIGKNGEGIVGAIDRSERQLLQQEDMRLKGFENMRKASDATIEIKNKLEQAYMAALGAVPFIVDFMKTVSNGIGYIIRTVDGWNIGESLRKIADSPVIRGVKGWFK